MTSRNSTARPEAHPVDPLDLQRLLLIAREAEIAASAAASVGAKMAAEVVAAVNIVVARYRGFP